MGRWKYVIIFTVFALIAFAVFFEFRAPPDLEVRSSNDAQIAWISFYAAISAAAAAFLSLIKEIVVLIRDGWKR